MTSAAILRSTRRAWSPDDFDRYRELYPASPDVAFGIDRRPTRRFAVRWQAQDSARLLQPRASRTTVVFVRGFLGHYMPGNLVRPKRILRRLGFDVVIAANRSGGSVAENVDAIARHLERRGARDRLVFCGHSRGGLECLTLLAGRPSWAVRCDGVVLSQTPHGSSRVIESILLGWHRASLQGGRRRAAEALQRAGLALLRARRGGLELTSKLWPALVAQVDGIAWPFRVLQTASWSSRPTAWLDSFHTRLREIAPARAHDGQFLLEDLIWPGLPHLLLPDVDHAQPVVGGHGFDPVRYWLSALVVALEEDGEREGRKS